MKRFIVPLLLVAFTFLCSFSCTTSYRRDGSSISGKQGEVLVVINKDYWESPLGQAIRDSLTQEYPMLPQIEPHFKVLNTPNNAFVSMFQTHRNIIRFRISPDYKNTVTFKKNVWARPQCVVEINASSYSDAEALFNANAGKIIQVIEDAERERLIRNNARFASLTSPQEVNDLVGGSPVFPIDEYKVIKKTEDFIWLSYNSQKLRKSIVVYKYPVVKGEDMMSPKSLIENNKRVINENIPGMFENTYMTHSKYVSPTVEYLQYNKRPFAEIRGLWEVENDYMGGPFITHVFYSQDGKYMIGVEGFVYAPKFDKIQYMREIEAVVYSFKWKEF